MLSEGHWDFLIPDSRGRIFIKGEPYFIPSSHSCVFVGNGAQGKFQHKRIQSLPMIQFFSYQKQDLDHIVDCWVSELPMHSKQMILDEFKMLNESVLDEKWSMFDLTYRFSLIISDLYRLFQLYCLDINENSCISKSYIPNLSRLMEDCCDVQFFVDGILSMKGVYSTHLSSLTFLKKTRLPFSLLTKNQGELGMILQTFILSHHIFAIPGTTFKSVLWIEGEAGCGKDYVTNLVLENLDICPIRTKGSDLQMVLDSAEIAKQTGQVLVIEEADLVCMDILRIVFDARDAHLKYCVIVTVNGRSYEGRQAVSPAVVHQIRVYGCSSLDFFDISKLLNSKFPNQLDEECVCFLSKNYLSFKDSMSPRDLFHIVDDFLVSERSISDCWDRRMGQGTSKIFLNTEFVSLEKLKGGGLKALYTPASGVFSDHVTRLGQSDSSFLPYYYYQQDKAGVCVSCSRLGISENCASSGEFHMTILPEDDQLYRRFGDDDYLILPIPIGTKPSTVYIATVDTDFQVVDHFFKDSMGVYSLSLPSGMSSLKFILKVQYEFDECVQNHLGMDGLFSNVYADYSLRLPRDIQAIIDDKDKMPIRGVLDKLVDVFQHMRYSTGDDARDVFDDARNGEIMVQRCLDSRVGCCYEFSNTFAAVVGKFLGLPVRVVSGLAGSSFLGLDFLFHVLLKLKFAYFISSFNNQLLFTQAFSGHARVDVCVDGKWVMFEVTPFLNFWTTLSGCCRSLYREQPRLNRSHFVAAQGMLGKHASEPVQNQIGKPTDDMFFRDESLEKLTSEQVEKQIEEPRDNDIVTDACLDHKFESIPKASSFNYSNFVCDDPLFISKENSVDLSAPLHMGLAHQLAKISEEQNSVTNRYEWLVLDMMKTIQKWCYLSGNFRPSVKATFMASSCVNTKVSLDLYYRTRKKVYQSSQIQVDAWEPYVAVLLTKDVLLKSMDSSVGIASREVFSSLFYYFKAFILTAFYGAVGETETLLCDDFSKEAVRYIYVESLLRLNMPVYVAMSSGIQRVWQYESICWEWMVEEAQVACAFDMITLKDLVCSLSFPVRVVNEGASLNLEGLVGGLDLEIKSSEMLKKVLSEFRLYFSKKKSSLMYVKCLRFNHCRESDLKEMQALIELVRPNELVLDACVLPLCEVDISRVYIRNALQDIDQVMGYGEACSGFRNADVFVEDMGSGRVYKLR